MKPVLWTFTAVLLIAALVLIVISNFSVYHIVSTSNLSIMVHERMLLNISNETGIFKVNVIEAPKDTLVILLSGENYQKFLMNEQVSSAPVLKIDGKREFFGEFEDCLVILVNPCVKGGFVEIEVSRYVEKFPYAYLAIPGYFLFIISMGLLFQLVKHTLRSRSKNFI
ncbi:MAG: hypothetical protein DRN47_00060 [Candidatus Wolframiiraptor sp.]|nr:MAG: hypothetical protein DRN47_00060 [Candidatus Wolframiiraptor sp.]